MVSRPQPPLAEVHTIAPMGRTLGAVPAGKYLALIVVMFALIVTFLVALAYLQMEVLSGVRAYVGGEALWSKGQKDAVQHLIRYARSGDEASYRGYQAAIAVPLGDHRARVALDEPELDLAVVRDGFVQGRNNSADVPSMALLYRRFRGLHFMAEAIAAWTAGDRQIAHVDALAVRLHHEVASDHPNGPRVAAILERIDVLNRRLTRVEARFSRKLGAGARRVKRILLEITCGTAVLLVTLGALFSGAMLRRVRAWEGRYRHLLNTANDGIIVTDLATGLVCEVNRKAGELLGRPPERLVGTPQAELFPADERARHAEVIEAVRRGTATTAELNLQDADGGLVPVEISAARTRLGGRPVVQSIIRDVGDRRRAEQERRDLLAREQAARAEAEHAGHVKDEFLSVLSHELRTPLTPILVWARILQRTKLAPHEVTRAVEAIERNASAQAQLVQDLLDVSRIISGKLRLAVRPVALGDVVRDAIDSVRVAADAKAIRLEVDVDPAAGPVGGDPDRLRQVAWNLLSNAIKFTPAGGRVAVAVRRVDSQVALVVQDTGKGILPEFLPHVFERFRQADSSSVREHGGLGLGLAIVRHLVEMHGGTVAATSAGEGQGAVFTISLPAIAMWGRNGATLDAPPAVDPRRGTSDEHAPTLQGVHVLVVDDHPDTRDLVATLLGSAGAEVHTAASVAETLEVLARCSVDVLVADVGMPGEDGHGLMRRIRSGEVGDASALPAVALTAYARDEDRAGALRAGFQCHVAKPFDPSELLAVVAKLAGRA